MTYIKHKYLSIYVLLDRKKSSSLLFSPYIHNNIQDRIKQNRHHRYLLQKMRKQQTSIHPAMFECHKLCIEISASAWNDKSSENLFTYQRSITSSGITFWSYLFFWPDTDFSCFPKANARDSAFIGIEPERRCLCCLLTPFRVINYLTIFELDFANGIDRTTRNRFFFFVLSELFHTSLG